MIPCISRMQEIIIYIAPSLSPLLLLFSSKLRIKKRFVEFVFIALARAEIALELI